MKKTLFLFFLSFSYTVYAQGLKMLHSDCYWYYLSYYEREGIINEGTAYKEVGIERIEEKEYHKIRVFHDFLDGVGVTRKKSRESVSNDELKLPIVLLREEGGKIYAERNSYSQFLADNNIFEVETPFFSSPDGEHLLYDFTLNEGATYPMNGNVTVSKVTKITTYDNIERRVFFLSNGMEIIEGIGCRNSLGELIGYQSSVATKREDGIIRGELISYDDYDVYIDFPLGMKFPSNEKEVFQTYDLSGRRVSPSSAPKGVYLKGGRKIVY